VHQRLFKKAHRAAIAGETSCQSAPRDPSAYDHDVRTSAFQHCAPHLSPFSFESLVSLEQTRAK
jgi:hypothetical protein